jgi:hypothetical protein
MSRTCNVDDGAFFKRSVASSCGEQKRAGQWGKPVNRAHSSAGRALVRKACTSAVAADTTGPVAATGWAAAAAAAAASSLLLVPLSGGAVALAETRRWCVCWGFIGVMGPFSGNLGPFFVQLAGLPVDPEPWGAFLRV